MDVEFALQIEARMRDWNGVVERERVVHRWKRLAACCQAAALGRLEATARCGK